MRWSDVSRTPSSRTLRQFAGLWLLVLGTMSCWQGLARGHLVLAVISGVAAASFGFLGLIRPRAICLLFLGCMVVTFPIGWIVARLLLACLFYGVFTPVGLLFRLIGRDVLARRYRPDQSTYWEPKPMPADMRGYLRQF